MVDSDVKGDPVFGARLQEAVRFSGKSRRQVALALGITAQSAQKWEKLGYLSKERIPDFCRECGVSIEWLLSGEGEIAAPNPLRDATDEEIIAAATEILSRQGQTDLIGRLANLIAEAQSSAR